uniref:INCENP_ARK-bind domain-containing protein n=1 Tax=Syphacia muris TaxID=451379 RepID=A0A0N5AE86_9BILA
MDGQSQVMIEVYMRDGLRGFGELVRCIEKRKLIFKQLIKAKTGKNIRQTPKRGNKLREWKSRLFAIDDVFKNDTDSDRLGQVCIALVKIFYLSMSFEASKCCSGNAQTTGNFENSAVEWKCYLLSQSLSIAKFCTFKFTSVLKQALSKNGAAISDTPVRSKYLEIHKSSNAQQKQNIVPDGKSKVLTSSKSSVLLTPSRYEKKVADEHVTTLSRLTKKPAKKSEIIRKLEAKQRTVINNKEEMIKIKVEKTRREREERAQRVLENNKKKEQEREAALKAIRQRELDLEELHHHEGSSTKLRNGSRPVTNSPARLRILHKISFKQAVPSGKTVKAVHQKKKSLKVKTAANILPATLESVTAKSESGLNEQTVESIQQSIVASNDKNLNSSNTKDTFAAAYKEDSGAISATGTPKDNDDTDVIKSGNNNYGDGASTVIEAQTAEINRDGGNCDVSDGTNTKILGNEREEVRERLGLLDSSELKNKNLMNVTSCSSYEITPPKKCLSPTDENYNIDDLSSGDETDEEDHPKKKIPNWAQAMNLRRLLREQTTKPPHSLDSFFGQIETPNLSKIFSISRSRYAKRTSSAIWNSPLANPREGGKLFHSHHLFFIRYRDIKYRWRGRRLIFLYYITGFLLSKEERPVKPITGNRIGSIRAATGFMRPGISMLIRGKFDLATRQAHKTHLYPFQIRPFTLHDCKLGTDEGDR